MKRLLKIKELFKATEGDTVNGGKIWAHPKWQWLASNV